MKLNKTKLNKKNKQNYKYLATLPNVEISADEMDQADMELKETIKTIWPLQAKNMVDLLVPPSDQLSKNKMSVGKIYAGLLILESWRSTRFGQEEPTGLPVRLRIFYGRESHR